MSITIRLYKGREIETAEMKDKEVAVKINYIKNKVASDNLSGVLISEDAAESLVRCVLPDIVSFFKSENGSKEFDEWNKNWDKLKEIL